MLKKKYFPFYSKSSYLIFFSFILLIWVVGECNNHFNKKDVEYQLLRALFYYFPCFPIVSEAIQSSDLSNGGPGEIIWNFGDRNISFEENPENNSGIPNRYLVSLKLTKAHLASLVSSQIMLRNISVRNYEKPKADFTYEPENPQVGIPVRFYDKSEGNPEKILWQFGYFNFSFEKNPIVTFLLSKKYAVTLTVKNQYGLDKITKYINVRQATNNAIISKSCSLKDVQAAIAQANPGDTVIVPNGRAVWNQQLLITKGIILKAATKGGVEIIGNFDAQRYTDNTYLIKYSPSSPQDGHPFRLSGFKINGGGKTEGVIIRNTSLTYPISKVRIDNNEFYNFFTDITAKVIARWGMVYGVVDNNIFYFNQVTYPHRVLGLYGLANNTWYYETYDFGTADNFFIEDNTFYIKNPVLTGDSGGRYCFRHNMIIADNDPYYSALYLLDIHGNKPNGGWSCLGAEVYDNTIYASNKDVNILDVRGGKALVYNNYVFYGNEVRSQIRDEYDDSLNPPANNAISGQPQHPSDTYFFGFFNNNNRLVPPVIRVLGTIDYGGDVGIVPRQDVHFWVEVSNFNGSSGVGVGLLSQRPATCSKEGVAWWATDENKLYRWHNGRWELYYAPYTYPHPLRTILGD